MRPKRRRRSGPRLSARMQIPTPEPQIVIPGRRAAASSEAIFQRPVFMDSGPRPLADPGMTRKFGLALIISALLAAGVSVALAQSGDRVFGEPRAEATAADRKIFEDGLKQFSRAWDAHDGVGARLNEQSCLGCHSVPKPGGRGTAANAFVIVSKTIADPGVGHGSQGLQLTVVGVIDMDASQGA